MLIAPLLMAGFVALPPSALGPDCGDACCGCGKANALRLRAAAGLPINEPGHPGYGAREALTDTDLISADLDMEIVPTAVSPNANIIGVCTMRVRSRVSNLTQFTFMLRNNFNITSPTINAGTPVVIADPPTNSYARTVTLDHAYGLNQEFTLRIPYSGFALSRGFGSILFQTQPSSSNPIVASLSEAYYAATWWPIKDGDVFLPGDNSDKFTMRLAVTAPSNLTTISNGTLQSVLDVAGGKRKYTWATNYPISSYLVCFSSSVYNTWTATYNYIPDGGGAQRSMPVQFYVYPSHDTPANRAAWQLCTQMLATYQPYYGLYPFVNEKYGIYDFPFGGGMEHQTMTGQGTFDEGVTSHELGHQWWGDNVTCKTWNDIWLNEGFATYTEAIWEQYKPGSAGTTALHAAMAARRPGSFGDSVYVYDTSDMNRIFSGTYSYRKGAWVLHMLRHIVGDTNFFNGLKEYRSRHQGSAAATGDFADAMGDTAGLNLTNYFDQWVFGIGAPTFSYAFQNASIAGRPYLRLLVRQTQDATWPGRGTPGDAFAMPIDVRVNSAAGSRTYPVNLTARLNYFLIPIDATASSIALDEFNWILNGGKTTEPYVQGPPKIALATPAPGSTLSFADAPTQVAVTFSDPVNTPGNPFSVTGPDGPVAFTVSGATDTRTLTFGSPLSPGVYTVTVRSVITSSNGGFALDGEILGNTLPTGDGVAGGDATFTFTVEPPCMADFNQDGGVDGADVESFFLAWEAADSAADTNLDGGVDGADVESFFLAWQVGGC